MVAKTISSIGGVRIPQTEIRVDYVGDENNMHKYNVITVTEYGNFSTWFYTGMGWNVDRVTMDDVLSSLVLDATSYANNACDDELRAMDTFADEFGYEKVSDAIKAFRGCKKAYNDLCKIWNCNADLLFDLANKYSEMGF